MQDGLKQAQELIRRKQYPEARALLQSLDHPKALEWLQKLDEKLESESQEPSTDSLNDTNPMRSVNAYAYPPMPQRLAKPKGCATFTLGLMGTMAVLVFLLPAILAFLYATFTLILAEQGAVNPMFAVAWYLCALILVNMATAFIILMKK